MKPFIFGPLIVLLVITLVSQYSHSLPNKDDGDDDDDDKVLSEILKELKLLSKESGINQKPRAHPSVVHEVQSEDVDNSEDKESYDDDDNHDDHDDDRGDHKNERNEKSYQRSKKLDPYEDLEDHLKKEGHKNPSNKFYGDDPDADPCGTFRPRVLTDPEGVVLSPGYESGFYGNNRTCSWKFVAPPGEVVEVKITSMDIEYNQECNYDLIEVFDVIDRKGVSIGKYCGSELPLELLVSSQDLLFLYFITDGTNDAGRFGLRWRMVPPKLDEPSTPMCGRPAIKPDVNKRIVNGEEARPFSWPWVVSIRVFSEGQWSHNCGGAILKEDVVVTAAHCFYDPVKKAARPLSQMRVVAGEFDEKTTMDGPTQTLHVRSAKVHEKYNQLYASSPHDIAVVVLDGRLKYNSHVMPVCLPREPPKLTSLCYVAGWGDTEHTGDRTVLNQVRLPVVNHNTCKRGDYYGVHMLNSMLCAGYEDGGKDACQRDSGSPLVCYNQVNDRWYMQGVASWAIGCAVPLKPGVYTRVTFYTDWIDEACGVRP